MQRPARSVEGLLISTVCLVLSCTTPAAPTPAADGGKDVTTTGRFAGSACAQCLGAACAPAAESCGGDPDCAAYLTCLGACSVASTGAVDPVCAGGCPKGASSSGAAAETALSECWGTAYCASCGTDAGIGLSPILHQSCPAEESPDACAACKANHCCQTEAACGAECRGYVDCRVAGGTAPECQAKYPHGLGHAGAAEVCVEVFCNPTGACNLMSSPCSSCIFEECTNEYVLERSTLVSAQYLECLSACSSEECETTCGLLYPGAAPYVNAVDVCATTRCPPCQ